MSSEHLPYNQRRAIHLLVSCGMSQDKVAESLRVAISTLRGWMKQELFAKKLEEAYQRIELHDTQYRLQHNEALVNALYAQIERHMENGVVEQLPFKDLCKMVRDFSAELRADRKTISKPGSGAESDGGSDDGDSLEDLKKRFESSTSGGTSKKEKLSLVEAPEMAEAGGRR